MIILTLLFVRPSIKLKPSLSSVDLRNIRQGPPHLF
jgi:hypothetical protein